MITVVPRSPPSVTRRIAPPATGTTGMTKVLPVVEQVAFARQNDAEPDDERDLDRFGWLTGEAADPQPVAVAADLDAERGDEHQQLK